MRPLYFAIALCVAGAVQAQDVTSVARAESLYVAGHADSSRALLAPSVAAGSRDPRVLTLYAYTSAADGRYAEAERIFHQVIQIDSTAIGAWIGLGLVQRATLRYEASAASYRKALQLNPHNSDARDGLALAIWEHRHVVTITGGQTVAQSQRGADWQALVQSKLTPNIDGALGAAHHRLQDISPGIGAIAPTATDETQLLAGLTVRATDRIKVATTALYRHTNAASSIMLWPELFVAVRPGLSGIAGVRPIYDDATKRWNTAVEAGVAMGLPYRQELTVRVLRTNRRDLEPPATFLANYAVTVSPRLQIRGGGAYGGGDNFHFTSGFAGVVGMLTPMLGFTAEYSQRGGTFARHSVSGGVVLTR